MAGITYELETAKRAIKFVDGVTPGKSRKALQASIKDLTKNPHAQGHRLHGKVEGYKALELRINKVDFRIIFRIDDSKRLVKVVDVDTHEGYNNRLKRGF